MISLSENIICVCEGSSEYEVAKILLDNNLLTFGYDNLVGDRIYKRKQRNSIEAQLGYSFDNKPNLLYIHDSVNEKIKYGKCLDNNYKLIHVITAPEIESLIVSYEGKYDEWKKSKIKKPSIYCKDKLGYKHVKSSSFVRGYFSDYNKLLDAIKAYKADHIVHKNCLMLWDIIKEEHRFA